MRGGSSIDPDQEERDRRKQAGPDLGSALALVFDLGFRLAGPIVIGVVAGAVLDGLLETSPWLLFLGVLVGVLVAFYALYDVSRTYGDRNRQ